jgi:hypothetical protein
VICILHQILLGQSKKKNEMDGLCSMFGIRERYIQDFGGGSEGKWPLGRTSVDGRI